MKFEQLTLTNFSTCSCHTVMSSFISYNQILLFPSSGPSELWFGYLSCHILRTSEIDVTLSGWNIRKLFTGDKLYFRLVCESKFRTTHSVSFTGLFCNSKLSSCFSCSWLKPTSLILFLQAVVNVMPTSVRRVWSTVWMPSKYAKQFAWILNQHVQAC